MDKKWLRAAAALIFCALTALSSDALAVTYSDQDSFATQAGRESAAVLDVLGVINGYPDGSFRPQSSVTRAELAKMICIAKSGGASIAFYENLDLGGIFGDVPRAHWASKYIGYCYYNGIIAGYGDGTFRPEQTVTATEAAKMLLAALGYSAGTEGLVGVNYAANTIRLAQSDGLLKNYTGGMDGAALREGAAVLLCNGLYANTVMYVGGSAVPRTGTLGSTDKITLAEEGFDLLDVSAVLVANDELGLGTYEKTALADSYGTHRVYSKASAGLSQFLYRTEANDSAGSYVYTAVTVATDSSYAMLGRTYRVLISKTADSGGVRSIYGSPIYSDVNAVEVTSTVKTDAAIVEQMPGYRSAAVNGLTPGDVVDGTAYLNGEAVSYDTLRAALGVGTTAPVTVISDDGRPVYVFAAAYTLSSVINADAATVALSGQGHIDSAKITVTDNGTLAAGDYVALYQNASNGIYTVKKLSKTVDNVTGYRASEATYLIGSTYYKKGALLSADDSGLMSAGLGAVRDTQFAYYFDTDSQSRFIAKVNVDPATKYAHFGLFLWADTDVKSYEPIVVKYMSEDGATLYATLADVNGYTVQPVNFSNSFAEGLVFGYALDAQGKLHIQTVNDLDGTADFTFDRLSGSLYNTANSRVYRYDSGVLFITYGQPATGGEESFVWKAYHYNDYSPVYANTEEAKHASNVLTSVTPSRVMPDRVKANSISGVYYVEAASVSFNDYAQYGYVLPGLPAAQTDLLATVLSVDVRVENKRYIYTYTIAEVNATGTRAVETIGFEAPYRVPETGYVYQCTLDTEGRVTSIAAYPVNSGDENDGIEKAAYQADSLYRTLDGKYQIIAKKLISSDGSPKLDTIILTVDPAQTDLYFVNGLFTADAEMWSPAKLPLPGSGASELSKIRLWLDYNELKNTLYNVWVDSAPASAYTNTVLEGIVPDEVRFDTTEGKWVYTFYHNDIGTLTVNAAADSAFNIPVGASVSMTFQNGELSNASYGELTRLDSAQSTASYDPESHTLQITGGTGAGTYTVAQTPTVYTIAVDGATAALEASVLSEELSKLGSGYTGMGILHNTGVVYSVIFYGS